MALLVAIGYTQLTCINFTETYSPVARFTSTIRILLSLTVQLGLKAYQMNLETSFMYADLVEEIYAAMAPGYDTPGCVETVQGTIRTGAELTSRNGSIDDYLRRNGFASLEADLYIRMDIQGRRNLSDSVC